MAMDYRDAMIDNIITSDTSIDSYDLNRAIIGFAVADIIILALVVLAHICGSMMPDYIAKFMVAIIVIACVGVVYVGLPKLISCAVNYFSE